MILSFVYLLPALSLALTTLGWTESDPFLAGVICKLKELSMIERASYSHRESSVARVINALEDFFSEKKPGGSHPVYASTRDIADRSDLSIYNARHILIKLEKEGVITSIKKENRKSLYWNKTEKLKKN